MRSVGVVAAAGLLLAGLSAVPAQAASGPLSWHDCRGDSQCATLRVPLDYAHPDAGTIGIAVIRTPATDPSHRKGSLVLNPGGPGVSGVDYASSMAWALPSAITASYDIVGFDPRGVAASARVHCQSPKELRPWLTADATPDTPAEERRFGQLSRAIGDTCAERSGDLLDHVGTAYTAQDMDQLRQALGEDTLNFIGASYGTYLGALYADAFPAHVGRMVLDGVVDPQIDQVGLTVGQIQGFDAAALRMVRACLATTRCPIPGRTAAQVLGHINDLLTSLDHHTLPSDVGGPLVQQEAITALLASLYSKGSWSGAWDSFADALDGDGTGLAMLGRGFLTSGASFLGSFYAISCADSPATPTRQAIRDWANAEGATHRVPELARYLAWSVLPCSTWPSHVKAVHGPVHASGAHPILVVGTRYDPATPYSWARSLTRQLDRAALLTYDGDGHTAFGQGSKCVDRTITNYLMRGALPSPPASC